MKTLNRTIFYYLIFVANQILYFLYQWESSSEYNYVNDINLRYYFKIIAIQKTAFRFFRLWGRLSLICPRKEHVGSKLCNGFPNFGPQFFLRLALNEIKKKAKDARNSNQGPGPLNHPRLYTRGIQDNSWPNFIQKRKKSRRWFVIRY